MPVNPKTHLESANRFLERMFPLLVITGLTLGVTLPGFFVELRSLVPWFFGTVTLAGALNLRVRELGSTLTTPRPFLFFFIVVRIFMPALAFALSSFIFRNNPDIVAGYVLLYAVPVAVTSFIWVTIFKGDAALALTLILLDTILAPIIVPGTVRLFLGTTIDLDMTGMALSLTQMIVIPTIVGVILNELSRGKIPAMISPVLNPFSKVMVLFVMAVNASIVAPQVRVDNPYLWVVIAVCVGFIVLVFIVARLVTFAGRFNREKQISFVFVSCMRNTVASLTLAIRYFPEAAALPAILGILLQQNAAAILGRVFFGRPRAD